MTASPRRSKQRLGHPPLFAFTGREWDGDAGLFYYRARWHDAGVGRSLSVDPIGFRSGDENFFRYVNNSPVQLRDPLGLKTSAECLGDFIDCLDACKAMCPGTLRRARCILGCSSIYTKCLATAVIEFAFGTLFAALDWIGRNPHIVIGTIILVAGIAMVVTMGPGGVLALAALA